MVGCKLLKRSAVGRAAPKKLSLSDPAPTDYALVDNEDGTITVSGLRADGTLADLSGVATLAVSSDNPTSLSVDPIDAAKPMVVTVHGLAAGTANVVIVATWTDGSVGPFTITVPATISASPPPPPSPIIGLAVTLGTPTIRG